MTSCVRPLATYLCQFSTLKAPSVEEEKVICEANFAFSLHLFFLFAAVRVIYSRCPLHLFVVFLCLFKRPGDCCENLNEKGLSFPDTSPSVRKTKT